MNNQHPILSTYSIIELCKLEASLAGIIVGFALTVSILLIEKHRAVEKGSPDQLAQLSIASFLVAFVASLATAFNFIVIGAELDNGVRLAIQYLPAGFALALSYVYLFMGIALALFEYRIADYMRGFLGAVCAAALLMVGGNINFTMLWVIAIWENTKLKDLRVSQAFSWTLLLLAILPSILVGLRLTWPLNLVPPPWRERFDRLRPILYLRTAIGAIALITAASLLSSLMSEAVPEIIADHIYSISLLVVALYSIVSTFAIILLPRRV